MIFTNYITHANVFRQSIDLYGSLPSPNLGFLANSSMSRLGSSFLSSTLTRRHTPETLPCVTKPLLIDEEAPKHKRSSHFLLPSKPSSMVSHEMAISNDSTFGQAVLNGEFHYNYLNDGTSRLFFVTIRKF